MRVNSGGRWFSAARVDRQNRYLTDEAVRLADPDVIGAQGSRGATELQACARFSSLNNKLIKKVRFKNY